MRVFFLPLALLKMLSIISMSLLFRNPNEGVGFERVLLSIEVTPKSTFVLTGVTFLETCLKVKLIT